VEVCAHHLHSPVEPPSTHLPAPLPARLEALLLSCLSKDPAGRPASAGQLVAALDGCTDVPSWSAQEARGWWIERGRRLKAAPANDRAPRSNSLLTVDLLAREGPATTARAAASS
jgi:hypothetical protein